MKKQMGHYAAIARKKKLTKADWKELEELREERGDRIPQVILDRFAEREEEQ